MRRTHFVVLALLWAPGAARAERLVPAFDPTLHAKPPHMRGIDGVGGPLLIDADFVERAARYRRQNPPINAQPADVVQLGEVVVVQGDESLMDTDGTGFRPRIAAVTRRVIEKLGDHFHSISLWLTFDERGTGRAEAYETTVKADVQGLGVRLQDISAMYGSAGTLRSVLNMKRVWARVAQDTMAAWTPHLETWGQESGHRWMMFMKFRDRRTGLPSDAMLGRDCSHYSRFVDTQASVHDGFAWTDNGNGTFTATEMGKRFGTLDLYGMGLLAADEVTPFFIIDDIPNYKHPRCGTEYESTPRPLGNSVSGRRIEITIDDIIAANGPRVPAGDERLDGQPQDYFREALVIVTLPTETANTPLVQSLANRLNKARLLWEDWMRAATRNRMVVCTQVSRDCGDPRSDVTEMRFNAGGKAPQSGPLTFEVTVANTGTRASAGVKVGLDVSLPTGTRNLPVRTLGALEVGGKRTQTFDVDLREVACGTEMTVKAYSQSDFHYHRQRSSFVLGGEVRISDGFEMESGWVVNPDGTDASAGARWERGKPERTEIVPGTVGQPGTAHGGGAAWVTGLAAEPPGGKAPFTYGGRTTLESPAYDASNVRDPLVRYWVSFTGVAAQGGGAIAPSEASRLLVLARRGDAGDWVEIDRLEAAISPAWALRSAKLPAELVGGTLKLRFVAVDENPRSGGVEAAIDDVELISMQAACYDPAPAEGGVQKGKGGCGVGGSGSLSLPALALTALALIRRRRRR